MQVYDLQTVRNIANSARFQPEEESPRRIRERFVKKFSIKSYPFIYFHFCFDLSVIIFIFAERLKCHGKSISMAGSVLVAAIATVSQEARGHETALLTAHDRPCP